MSQELEKTTVSLLDVVPASPEVGGDASVMLVIGVEMPPYRARLKFVPELNSEVGFTSVLQGVGRVLDVWESLPTGFEKSVPHGWRQVREEDNLSLPECDPFFHLGALFAVHILRLIEGDAEATLLAKINAFKTQLFYEQRILWDFVREHSEIDPLSVAYLIRFSDTVQGYNNAIDDWGTLFSLKNGRSPNSNDLRCAALEGDRIMSEAIKRFREDLESGKIRAHTVLDETLPTDPSKLN